MARIAELDLGDHVTWLGYVDEARLRALYDNALAIAVPSRYEGFGLPVIEAMSRGIPLVTSDAASLPEVTGGAALQVPPLDVAAWADALARVAGDAVLRETLRDAGRRRVRPIQLGRCRLTALGQRRRRRRRRSAPGGQPTARRPRPPFPRRLPLLPSGPRCRDTGRRRFGGRSCELDHRPAQLPSASRRRA